MKDTFVYVIGTVRGGVVGPPSKIGISSQPDARVWALQTACPDELMLVSSHRLPGREIALQVEDCFHQTQRDHRLRGEWFDLHPSQATIILRLQIRWAIELFTDLTDEELRVAYEMAGLN